MGCACKYSKCDKTLTEEPEQTSSPNSVPTDQVEISSVQPQYQYPHHRTPSLEPGQAKTGRGIKDRIKSFNIAFMDHMEMTIPATKYQPHGPDFADIYEQEFSDI